MKKENNTTKDPGSTIGAVVANRFGIPIWTGKDIENFRRKFAPKGKEKMSFDDLAELLGLKHRSQAKRLADQEIISPSMSITLEYIKRLLTEERNGYFVEWKPKTDGENKYQENVERQDKIIKLMFIAGEPLETEKSTLNISFIKPIELQINRVENQEISTLHRLRFD